MFADARDFGHAFSLSHTNTTRCRCNFVLLVPRHTFKASARHATRHHATQHNRAHIIKSSVVVCVCLLFLHRKIHAVHLRERAVRGSRTFHPVIKLGISDLLKHLSTDWLAATAAACCCDCCCCCCCHCRFVCVCVCFYNELGEPAARCARIFDGAVVFGAHDKRIYIIRASIARLCETLHI